MQLTYETPRLTLQILKPDHKNAERVLAFYDQNRELFEAYEPDRVPNYYTTAFQREVLKYEYDMAVKQAHLRFYIFLKEDPEIPIGTVCFHNIQRNYYNRCEIGYKIAAAHHRKGYAKEAINYALTAVFEELGIHRVNAWVDVENAPSLALLDKLGFEREGVCKDYLFSHGVYKDHVAFCMINPFHG